MATSMSKQSDKEKARAADVETPPSAWRLASEFQKYPVDHLLHLNLTSKSPLQLEDCRYVFMMGSMGRCKNLASKLTDALSEKLIT